MKITTITDELTLKGKKNHYNIKLLRGYGVSIYLKNNHIVLKDGIDILTNQAEKEEWFVTQIPYEKIVISGSYLSSSSYHSISSFFAIISATRLALIGAESQYDLSCSDFNSSNQNLLS
ncbi:MAG: hypothetical protein ACRD38_11200 [Nitrososphaerales archaeon]